MFRSTSKGPERDEPPNLISNPSNITPYDDGQPSSTSTSIKTEPMDEFMDCDFVSESERYDARFEIIPKQESLAETIFVPQTSTSKTPYNLRSTRAKTSSLFKDASESDLSDNVDLQPELEPASPKEYEDYVKYEPECSSLDSNDSDSDLTEGNQPEPELTSPKPSKDDLLEFKCEICFKTFESRATLNGHIIEIHEVDKEFQCSKCGRAFISQEKLDSHIREVNDRFTCSICPKTYCLEENLRKHMEEHEKTGQPCDPKSYKCFTCGKSFLLKNVFKIHELGHSKEKPHKCDFCPKSFVTFCKLRQHLANTHGTVEKRHKCPVCSKEFYRQYDLKRHLASHSEERNFKCKNCPATFKTDELLKTHIKENCSKTGAYEDSHIEPQPVSPKPSKDDLVCEFCQKSYKLKAYLEKHINIIHNGQDGQLKCEVCSKAFKTRAALNDHMIGNHVVDKAFKCSRCGRVFVSQESLDSHKLKEHERLKCKYCSMTYCSEENLRKHIEEHMKSGDSRKNYELHKCETCGKVFSRRHLLTIHEMRHRNERPHKCNLCPKSFVIGRKLREHLAKVHCEGVLQHKCPVCSKEFYTQGELKRHSAIHSEERNIKCKNCPATFKTMGNLKIHQSKYCHPGKHKKDANKLLTYSASSKDRKNDLECRFCHKTISSRKGLARHIFQLHVRDKDDVEKCEFCPKSFKNKRTLKDHIVNVHVVDKEFQCSKCSRAFISQEKLDSHVLAAHERLKCTYCTQTYRLEENLRKHMEEHEKSEDTSRFKIHKCETCGKCFSNKRGLTFHEMTHKNEKPYKCDLCPKSFVRRIVLEQHIASHHRGERPFKCPECPKAFYRKSDLVRNHLPSHSEERNFKCDKCQKCYKIKNLLDKHKKRCPVTKGIKTELDQ